MSKIKFNPSRWFKSDGISLEESNVDFEAGIIKNVILCEVGEAKGHGLHLEQEFIDSLHAYALKHHKVGMKARFGHPSMSNESLGTEMGRFKNFQLDGSLIRADLHLFESANLSPNNPGIKDWMLNMADEDANAIMCSIVFQPASLYQYDVKGNQQEVSWDMWDGVWVPKDPKAKLVKGAKTYPKLKAFTHTDIVDEGAATSKLFSAQFNQDKFGVIATEFLNEYPQVAEFIKEKPQKLQEFLEKRFKVQEDPEPEETDDSLSPDTNLNSNNSMSKIDMTQYARTAKVTDLAEAESTEDGVHFQEQHLQTVETALEAGETSAARVTELEALLSAETTAKETAIQERDTARAALKNGPGTPPGAAGNAEDAQEDEELKNENPFYCEADAEMDEMLKQIEP